jgi:threonine dehydratase
VDDDAARAAMRRYRHIGVWAGESGAAGLAGLAALVAPEGRELRRALGVDASSAVLLLVTEGVTDPVAYGRIVEHGPASEPA